MRILAIESSCDETSVAIVSGEGERVRPEVFLLRSQIDIHKAYGGVVPEVAARDHLAYMFPMVREALAGKEGEIDAIAVTAGPGLAPALRVGVETAKALAWAWNKPLVPVCHLEGHIYAPWLRGPDEPLPQFPALALIVSGGHTELALMPGHGQFVRLGETLDDAAGEAFDKVAKMMGLPYPGGPQIERLAKGGDATAFAFPRAMTKKDDLDFSFSGVKTSVLYTLRAREAEMQNNEFRQNIAASFQEAVVDVLAKKVATAIRLHPVASVIVAGGVAANTPLRERLMKLGETLGVPVFVPPIAYSLDNAAMIGVAGYFRAQAGQSVDPLQFVADPNMDIV